MHVRHVFFVHFYAVTTRPRLAKGPISRYIEDVNKPRQNSLSFSELGYGS